MAVLLKVNDDKCEELWGKLKGILMGSFRQMAELSQKAINEHTKSKKYNGLPATEQIITVRDKLILKVLVV